MAVIFALMCNYGELGQKHYFLIRLDEMHIYYDGKERDFRLLELCVE